MRRLITICALAVIILTVGSAQADLTVSSMFDTDLDGWTSNTPSEIYWEATNGNPDGYLRFVDSSGERTYAYAPNKFLGDWSPLNGVGVLSFDQKVFYAGSINTINPYTVLISGPGGDATWEGATPPGQTDWISIEVCVNETDWTINAGTWDAILNNVTKLEILMELVNNHGTDKDRTGLDNVALTPVPSAVILGGIGITFSGWLLKRRKML
ncbi:MAG: hypothetical protein ACFFCW_29250 [Candidatus Hodarchaeota archaeon]